MARLVMEEGRNKDMVFDLLSDNTTIGRTRHNTIQIEDDGISSSHCLIEKHRSSYYLKDLNSTNGTFLNQKPVGTKKLASGDKITLGKVILVFQKDAGEGDKGLNTIAEETSEEVSQGKGYATLLSETVREVKNKDLKKAAKRAEKSGGLLKNVMHGFGWSKSDADKFAGGKRKDDFPRSLIIDVHVPKSNERVLKLKSAIEGVDNGSIVNYQGQNYLVFEVKPGPDGASVVYRLKEC